MKKLSKIFSIILTIIMLAFVVASCSASAKNDSAAEPGMSYENDVNPDNPEEDVAAENYTSISERKIIQNVDLDIEVESVEKAYDAVLKNAVELGGYEFQREMSKSGDYDVINAVIKIPAEKLSQFTESTKGLGNVINYKLTSQDIDDEYFAAEIHLETLENTLAKYYEFLENAKTISEQLEITNQISEITKQIEQLKGTLEKWDDEVDFSTVALYIRQLDDPINIKKDIQWNALSLDDMWYMIKSGFTSVASFLISLIQWIFIAISSGSIIIIPAVAVVVIILIRKKRKSKSKK